MRRRVKAGRCERPHVHACLRLWEARTGTAAEAGAGWWLAMGRAPETRGAGCAVRAQHPHALNATKVGGAVHFQKVNFTLCEFYLNF